MKRQAGAWLLCCGLAAGAQGELQDDLQALLREERLAGAVVGLLDGDETRLLAVGHAHAPTRAPIQVGARVHVGSVAKPLLSLCVMRLASQGRWTLDTPLHDVLPHVALDNPWGNTHPVRLRHLLDHTAGLQDLRLWHLFHRGHTGNMPLAAGLQPQGGLLTLRTPPGTRMSYSNIGYLLVGMAIEGQVGEPYEDHCRRELLQPLGLVDSSFAFASPERPGADPRLAWGHDDDLRPLPAMATAARPGAQFVTTAADMLRLARAVMTGGAGVVDAALLRQMGRPRDTDAARAGLAAGYALGLATRDRHGAVGLCHEGSVAGYRAMWCLFPQHRRAFFVGFNSDSETARYTRVYERLVHELGVSAALPAAPVSAGAGIDAANWNGHYAPSPGRFAAFALLDRVGAIRQWEADEAQARWSGTSAALVPAGPSLWRQSDRLQASHVLLRDATGAALVSDGLRSHERITTAHRWTPTLLLLCGAAGALWWLVMPPLRRWRDRTTLQQPAWGALLLLPAAAASMIATGWQALGEPTLASLLLAATTALLPAAFLWQAARAWVRRAWIDLLACVAVLATCALLATAGLLPLTLWR